MPANQTSNGKAFEYACLKAIYDTLSPTLDMSIDDSPQYRTAKSFYDNLPLDEQKKYNKSAMAAIRVIVRLEPQLQHNNIDLPLYLSIQTDANGIAGDVRDVLCIRRQNNWQVGLSCKHNHHAVKHSRLSSTIDFGQDWFGFPCSEEYFSAVTPLFSQLEHLRDESKASGSPALWSSVENKAQMYYIPILDAFLAELNRLATAHPDVPSRLIHYLLGRYDFYKVITDDARKTTRIEAINIAGTLNRPFHEMRSIVNISPLSLPTRFYHTGFKQKPDGSFSDNTIEVVCDNGWAISMRIHNASSKIEPSLKFDVNLISLPSSVHAQVEPW